jgi:uncharacterized protein (TIGR03067 family)
MHGVLPVFILATLAFAPAPKIHPSVKDWRRCEGTWVLVSETSGVKVGPRSGPRMLTFSEGHCRMIGRGIRTPWKVTLNAEAHPKQMDLEPVGLNTVLCAIYLLNGDSLTICFKGSSPKGRPASISETGDCVRTWVFKRKSP